jgi:SAM-dependent methyltransferase
MTKLNIGCGPNVFYQPGWINYDCVDMAPYIQGLKTYGGSTDAFSKNQQRILKHLKSGGDVEFKQHDFMDGLAMHEDNSVDGIYLGQVIEHLNRVYEVPKFLAECRRIMKPGAVIRITTPDLNVLITTYLAGKMSTFAAEQPDFYYDADPLSQLAYIMYGASGPDCTRYNYEGHMFLYTSHSMAAALEQAGFVPPFDFYWQAGKSRDASFESEIVDEGMSHSFVSEATK